MPQLVVARGEGSSTGAKAATKTKLYKGSWSPLPIKKEQIRLLNFMYNPHSKRSLAMWVIGRCAGEYTNSKKIAARQTILNFRLEPELVGGEQCYQAEVV